VKTLGIYHWNYNNKAALDASISSFRKYHPHAPYFLACDGGGQDQYEVCKKHNVEYYHSQMNIGYPSQHWGHNRSNVKEFFRRMFLAAITLNTSHFVVSEDDVICLNEIQFNENWEIAAYDTRYINGVLAQNGHNDFSYFTDDVQSVIIEVSGVKPNHPYYGAGAGVIIKTSTFIENFYKVMLFLDKYFDELHAKHPQMGWNDYFIQLFYFVAGKPYTVNPRLYNIFPENPNADLNELKKNYDMIHNFKNYYEGI